MIDINELEVLPLNVVLNKFHLYVLFNDRFEIVYIGITSDLKKRLEEHIRSVKDFSYIAYKIYNTVSAARNEERDLIEVHKPRYNIINH